LTWERGKKPRDLYHIGDTVQAYILKVDRETMKISLSLKRAQPEQWDDTVNRYVIGQILVGRITKIMAFGAFVRLEGPVEGLIHISELSNRRIQTPKDVVKEGDVVPVKLVRIEKDRHRLGLSLRQARNDAEAMGFVFDHEGKVIDYPDDVREEFALGPRSEMPAARQQPRSAQEAIEQAVSRDSEPVSAMAHAFAQAFENAGDNSYDGDNQPAQAGSEPAEAENELVEADIQLVEAENELVEADSQPVEAENELAEADYEPAEADNEPVGPEAALPESAGAVAATTETEGSVSETNDQEQSGVTPEPLATEAETEAGSVTAPEGDDDENAT
jgi:predicted RNA-binding protein with RPS1 domain